jgi:hypothetical protein
MLQSSGPRAVDVPLLDWVYDSLEDETDYREFYVTKGYGAGGTFGLPFWHLGMCFINRDSPLSWSVAPTYQQVRDALIPAFQLALGDYFGFEEGPDYSIVQSMNPRIELHVTDQEIHLKSANNPGRLVAATVSHLSGTEPGLWPEMAFQKAFARVRCPKAKRRQKMLEGTPEGLGNGFEQRANFPEGLNAAKNRVRIRLETQDNPVLTEEYIAALAQAYERDPHKLRSYLYGEFAPFTKGTAYWEYAESRTIKLGMKAWATAPIIFAIDLGVAPLAWVAMQNQLFETRSRRLIRRYCALEEGTGKEKGLREVAASFIAAFDPAVYKNTPIEIDGGADGWHATPHADSCAFEELKRLLLEYYTSVKITAPDHAPGVRDRLEQANTLLEHELFVVAPHLKNLRNSLSMSCLKEGTWELVKKRGQDPTHFADAATTALYHRTINDAIDGKRRRRVGGLLSRF